MTDPQTNAPTPQQLKAALKAFRKRLKLTRLDEESKLTRNPLTRPAAKIVAMSPPTEFPQEVWDELVKQGKLKKAGHGCYELVEGN